jgi:peptidyl-prolyl cis-trans isomerase A (cyclophilin A)
MSWDFEFGIRDCSYEVTASDKYAGRQLAPSTRPADWPTANGPGIRCRVKQALPRGILMVDSQRIGIPSGKKRLRRMTTAPILPGESKGQKASPSPNGKRGGQIRASSAAGRLMTMWNERGLNLGLAALLCLGLSGCGSNSDSGDVPTASISSTGNETSDRSDDFASPNATPSVSGSSTTPPNASQSETHPEVVMTTSKGTIRIRLYADKAPLTVDNFLENYVDRGFYDGTIFHYVEKGFMVIAGGYTANGEAKEARAPIRNESDNGLKNTRGTVAMSRHPDYGDSASSQFFINLVDNPSLDFVKSEDPEGEDPEGEDPEGEDTYGYCVFGVVTEGMDVVDQIAEVAVHDTETLTSTPQQPILIQSVKRTP